MVKASSSIGKSKTGALRIDMKRKLTLPPPFVVNRGYTPDYPWLGQDHPAPKPKPRLLMQQSCSGAVRTAVCVVCAVLGIALILFAGNAIFRSAAERAALHAAKQADAKHHDAQHDLGLHPEHAALVQEDPFGQDVVGALVSSMDGQHYAPDPDEHLAGDGGAVSPSWVPVDLRMVDPVLPEDAPAAPSDPDVPVAEEDGLVLQAAEGGKEGANALQATKHLLLLMRMQNLVGLQREMEQRVQVTDALREAYEKLQAAEAATAAGDEVAVQSGLGQTPTGPISPLVNDAQPQAEAQAEAQPQVQQEDQEQQQQQDAVGEGARLLTQWMTEAQSSDQQQQGAAQQDTVDEDARLLVQWMMQAQPTEQELQEKQEEPRQDTADEDARLLAQWMKQASEQDGEKQAAPQAEQQAEQQGDHQGDQQGDQQGDAEAVHQILLWLTSSPQFWNVEEPALEDIDRPDLPLHEDPASASAALSPTKPEVDVQPSPVTTVVPWDQLNEDDKQDALLPKLAARGLDLHQEEASKTAVVATATPMLGDNDVATQVESDVAASEPQGELHGELHGAPQDEMQYEAQQARHYRHLVSQRYPLMYHVLHLRRSQQDAVQQEQRATAYLRLLDLHLLQHQQEAEARRQQRQHQQDVLRLEQDEAQWAQQDQWVQQDQQSYQQGPAYVQLRPARHLHRRAHIHHRRHQHAF